MMKTKYKTEDYFPAIDVLKFLFAILIMCLHGGIFKESQFGVFFEKIIVRLAVPFFFITSGFFYGRKVYGKNDLVLVAKGYINRLSEKLLIFEPISILIFAAQDRVSNHIPFPVIIRESIRHILFYPRGALWYIQAVIIAVLILIPFVKRKRENIALFLGLIFYAFALLCNRYYFLCKGTALESVVTAYMECFISARNGVFVGLLYVSMGMLIAQKWEHLQQKKNLFSILTLVSGLCLILEVCFTNNKAGMDDNSLFIAHLVLIPSMLICAGCPQNICVEKYIETSLLRNLSTSIYLLHSPILRVTKYGYEILFDRSLQPWQITLIAAIVIAFVCTFVYRKKRNPFYRWIK